jgi:hypothetical protein
MQKNIRWFCLITLVSSAALAANEQATLPTQAMRVAACYQASNALVDKEFLNLNDEASRKRRELRQEDANRLCRNIPFEEYLPVAPQNILACYAGGQAWIHRRTLIKSYAQIYGDFNQALSACTWRTPEAKGFTWPKDFSYFGANYYSNMLAKTPDGDWMVGICNVSSDSGTSQYVRIPKSGSAPVIYSGPACRNYFFGFDFSSYVFGKNEQAFGVMNAYIYEAGSNVSLELIGIRAPNNAFSFQRLIERIGRKAEDEFWVLEQCAFTTAPDPRNVYAKVIQRCKSRQAKVLADVRTLETSVPLPDKTKELRWYGQIGAVGFADYNAAVEAWLMAEGKRERKEKALANKIVAVKIIKTKVTSSVQSFGGVKFRTITQREQPKGYAGSASNQWFEIVNGIAPVIAKKITADARGIFANDYRPLDGPETRENDNKLYYGQSSASVAIVAAYKHVLTVLVADAQSPPFNRSYDESYYVYYDLLTGDRRMDWSNSFVTPRARNDFFFWITGQFYENLVGENSAVAPFFDSPLGHGNYALIAKPEGLEIIAIFTGGGHSFNEKIGVVPYATIPLEWLMPNSDLARLIDDVNKSPKAPTGRPYVKPKVRCGAKDLLPLEKNICDGALSSEFNELLLIEQTRIELFSQDEFDIGNEYIEEYANFMNQLRACPEGNRACLKDLIDKQIAHLHNAPPLAKEAGPTSLKP